MLDREQASEAVADHDRPGDPECAPSGEVAPSSHPRLGVGSATGGIYGRWRRLCSVDPVRGEPSGPLTREAAMQAQRSEYEKDVTTNHPYLCNHCERVWVLALSADPAAPSEWTCPGCGKTILPLDVTAREYRTCLTPTCSQYLSTVATHDSRDRCEGKRSDKKGLCLVALAGLDHAHLQTLPADRAEESGEKKDPAAVRRLRSEMAKVESFIDSSGTHHASKGGKHTRGATQTHTAAHGSKKQVRDDYQQSLEKLADAVEELDDPAYRKLVKEARHLANQVHNK
jgi:hypothetical protein